MTTTMKFSSSLKPFILWMRLLGIELDESCHSSCFKGFLWLIPAIGLAFLVAQLSVSIYIIYFIFYFPLGSSATFSWNMLIDYAVTSLLNVGVHAALLATTQQRTWKMLWSNLQELYADHLLIESGRLRRMMFFALAYILVV